MAPSIFPDLSRVAQGKAKPCFALKSGSDTMERRFKTDGRFKVSTTCFYMPPNMKIEILYKLHLCPHRAGPSLFGKQTRPLYVKRYTVIVCWSSGSFWMFSSNVDPKIMSKKITWLFKSIPEAMAPLWLNISGMKCCRFVNKHYNCNHFGIDHRMAETTYTLGSI